MRRGEICMQSYDCVIAPSTGEGYNLYCTSNITPRPEKVRFAEITSSYDGITLGG